MAVAYDVNGTLWFSVTEQLPPCRGRYIALTEEGRVVLTEYFGTSGTWFDSTDDSGRVLMWADLPVRPDWNRYAQPILAQLDADTE